MPTGTQTFAPGVFLARVPEQGAKIDRLLVVREDGRLSGDKTYQFSTEPGGANYLEEIPVRDVATGEEYDTDLNGISPPCHTGMGLTPPAINEPVDVAGVEVERDLEWPLYYTIKHPEVVSKAILSVAAGEVADFLADIYTKFSELLAAAVDTLRFRFDQAMDWLGEQWTKAVAEVNCAVCNSRFSPEIATELAVITLGCTVVAGGAVIHQTGPLVFSPELLADGVWSDQYFFNMFSTVTQNYATESMEVIMAQAVERSSDQYSSAQSELERSSVALTDDGLAHEDCLH
jgi:hypothetical protein